MSDQEYMAEVHRYMATPRDQGGPVKKGGAPIRYDFKPPTSETEAALDAPVGQAIVTNGVNYGADPLAGLPKAAPNIVSAGGVDYGPDPLAKPYIPPPSPEPPKGPGGPPSGPVAQTNPNELTLMQVGGGGMTAPREMDMRGPSLQRAQNTANAAATGAVGNVEDRNQAAAAYEYQQSLDQERSARAREQAWDTSIAERQAELDQTHQDFQASVKQLGKMSLDPNRFWASRSTGQKIGAFIGIALGGFVQGARGGANAPLDALNMQIDRDLKAQEFAYGAAADKTKGKQTAFGMAMQKYNNVDAARAMSRAAALDGVQAQLAQTAALWKGTDAGNRADIALAQIEQTKMEQIAQGVRFIPSQLAPRMYVDTETGLRYTEAEAKGLVSTQRGYEQQRQMEGIKTGGDILKEGAKSHFERQGYGGLGKAGAEKMALEEAKTQQELDANRKAITGAMSDVDAIVKGGAVGKHWAELPAAVPGVEGARNNVNAREAYNRRVIIAVGAAYKLGTDAMEPKNREMVEHFAQPFTILPSDNKQTAMTKMTALNKLVTDSAEAKGAKPPGLPSDLKFHGK